MSNDIELGKNTEYRGIDKDVLGIINDNINISCLGSDKEVNRMILNFHAESLSLEKELNTLIGQFISLLTIITQDEVSEFMDELNKNIKLQEKANKDKKDAEA